MALARYLNRIAHSLAILCLLATASTTMADTPATEQFRWSIVSADYMGSKIQVFRDNKPIHGYELGCDVSESLPPKSTEKELQESESNKVSIVRPISHPNGLLIARCRQGAHSMRLSVFDLSTPKKEPAWEEVGSYYANWQLNEKQELWLNYDEPCSEKSCESRFRPVSLQWPIKQ